MSTVHVNQRNRTLKSVITALNNQVFSTMYYSDKKVTNSKAKSYKLSMDRKIYFQWILGHCRLQGDEEADKAAKAATNMHHRITSGPREQSPNSCLTKTRKALRDSRIEWWNDEPTGRHLYSFLKTPNKKVFQIPDLPQELERGINRDPILSF